jgi:hypothetical protein
MKKRLIITENQFSFLKKFIHENSVHEICVEKIKNDLNANYEPVIDNVLKGGEYFKKGKFKILASESKELIDVNQLFEYLKSKYPYSENFLKQVIIDWCDGNLKNSNVLSKNISIT